MLWRRYCRLVGCCAFVVAAVDGFCGTARAANKTWVALDPVDPTNFEKAANWSPSGVPGNSTLSDIGVFNFNVAPNNLTPTLTIDRSINGLDFESGGFTLGGNHILTIGRPSGSTPMIESVGAGTNTINDWASISTISVGTIDVGAGNTLIAGYKLTGAFAKTGPGTLRLSVNNDPNLAQGLAGFKVNGGVVELNGSISDYISTTSSSMVVNNGGTLRWLQNEQMVNGNGHVITIFNGGLADLNGHTESSGQVFFHDGGTFSTGSGVFIPLSTLRLEYIHDVGATSATAYMNGNFNVGAVANPSWLVDRGTASIDLQINALLQGTGTFGITGRATANTLDPSGGPGIVLLTNPSNSYTGATVVNGGTLLLAGNAPSAAGVGILGNNTGAVALTGAIQTNGAYTIGRPVTVNFALSNSYIGGNTVDASTFSNTITLLDTVNKTRFTAVSGGTCTFSGNITGGGGVEKWDNGVVRFSHASNGYTGNTTITAGKLIVSADGALGTSAGTTSVTSGAALGFDGGINYSTAEPVTIAGTGPAGAGAIENISGANTFAGPITLSANSTIGATAGSLTLTGSINTNGKALTFLGAVNLGGAITGTAGLNKTGAGTVVLSGSNSYTGLTVVQAGALVLQNGASGNAQAPVLTGAGADVQGGKLVLDYLGNSANDPAADPNAFNAHISTTVAAGEIYSSTADSTHGVGWTDDTTGGKVVIAYTYLGDANVDGVVNTSDFTALAQHFNDASNVIWPNGDFNYDGQMNALDFNFLATNYGATPISSQALGTLVPEPVSLGMLTLAAAWIGPRRRFRGTSREYAVSGE